MITRAGKAIAILGSIVGAQAGFALAGLRVPPEPFAPVAPPYPNPVDTMPLPSGLPSPVDRYYRLTYGQTYGERMPVLTSAVITSRGTMRIGGITFPARCRFMHVARGEFRAYFELTFYGQPVMKVNEHFVDDKLRQELPFGVEQGEPKNDHSAAIRMWSEWVLWAPAMLFQHPGGGVRWEPVDNSMALLVVPVLGKEERLVARFDESTGDVQYVEGMKYKYPGDNNKTLWVNAIWLGDKPWATFDVEDKTYNVDVNTSLDVRGPRPSGT